MPVPILETERLILRPPKKEDAEVIFRSYAQDPDVTRFVDWPPARSFYDTEAFISDCIARLRKEGQFPWAVTLRDEPDGPMMGMIELRQNSEATGHMADTGYVLARPYWGKGYMTEGLAAVLEFGFTRPALVRIWAVCDVENVGSARVMDKAGMQREIGRAHV